MVIKKCVVFVIVLLCTVFNGAYLLGAPFGERWQNPAPYGVLFNQYDPNFYTGFAPRVQKKREYYYPSWPRQSGAHQDGTHR